MITDINQLDLNGTYSYSDYLTWKFEGYVELLRGKISKMASPTRYHQRVAGRVYTIIEQHLWRSKCQAYIAPFDVRLLDREKTTENKDVFTVIQPDICVICDISKLDDKGCVGAPDLIVEVLSPSTKKKDVEDKFQLYEFNGVREYWIASPADEMVTVFDLDDNGKYQFRKIFVHGSVIKSSSIEGLEVDTNDVFWQKDEENSV